MSQIDGGLGGDEAFLLARRCVLTALYLPGLERAVSPRRAGAGQILRALLLNPCELGQTAQTLETAGYWEAALCLSQSGLLARAENLVESTQVLTAACPCYPQGWNSIPSAPAALWLEGEIPVAKGLAVVGSREPPEASRELAQAVSAEAVRLGYAVVSGGAPGCDWIAAKEANTALIELLPCGVGQRWGVGTGCRLSAREPREPFSTSAAMERNALIYAFGAGSVLCHAKFKTGGAWVGATEALRRKLGNLMVWDDRASLASRALIALGGIPLPNASSLEETLARGPQQASLFSSPAC